MPDPTLKTVAPRLYRAHVAEQDYQCRLRRARATGAMPFSVACEELARTMREVGRNFRPVVLGYRRVER